VDINWIGKIYIEEVKKIITNNIYSDYLINRIGGKGKKEKKERSFIFSTTAHTDKRYSS
jgi:hypothetical protein